MSVKIVYAGGRLKALLSGLHAARMAVTENKIVTENGITIPSKLERESKILDIRRAFLMRLHLNKPWSYYLSVCEFLNLVNVVMQFFLIDWFLQGAFMNFGTEVIETDFSKKITRFDEVFPKVRI